MATPQSAVAYLQQVYQNTLSLLVLVDMVIAYPTQANIDAVVAGSFGTNLVQLRENYSLDGESYDWVGYKNALIASLLPIEKSIQRAGGPYFIRQRVTLGPGITGGTSW